MLMRWTQYEHYMINYNIQMLLIETRHTDYEGTKDH